MLQAINVSLQYGARVLFKDVNLASIINKEGNGKYRSELFRNIDFGIFTKNFE